MSTTTRRRYFGDLENHDDLVQAAYSATVPEDHEIVFAAYWDLGYEGSGFLIYRRDGDLYLDDAGGHCSCYGPWDGGVKGDKITWDGLRAWYFGNTIDAKSRWRLPYELRRDPEACLALFDLLLTSGEGYER